MLATHMPTAIHIVIPLSNNEFGTLTTGYCPNIVRNNLVGQAANGRLSNARLQDDPLSP